MKTLVSLPRVAFLALALGTLCATAALAQTATNAPPTCTAGMGHRYHGDFASVLTADEKAQLKKAHEAALAANPALQTQQASLKQQFQSLKSQAGTTTPAQWQALRQQRLAFREQMNAAELSVDPTLAPVFAKLAAANK
ncbi:MAG: hypothetical protein LV480_00995 [Methylacidiphilales bacterium]|nr:hypothetical protein [Candidatus Methylacidiphilales bacterium]